MGDGMGWRNLLIGIGAIGTGALVYGAVRSFRDRAAAPGSGAPPLPTPPPRLPETASWWQDGAPPPGAHHFDPLVERWRPAVTHFARQLELPIDSLLKWIRIESGGDMGDGKQMGGIPGREAGIFQLDFPGDSKYGATFEGLRQIAEKSATRKDPLDLSWMTPAELDMQVGSGVRKVAAARQTVRDALAATGTAWPESSPDFGNAVKQIHATPGVITELLPKITKRDGAPPATWTDLHHLVMTFPVDQMSGLDKNGHPYGLRLLAKSPSKHGLANRLEDTLRNAEEFGQASKFGPAWPSTS
jgi:hypothetical protein